MNLRRSRSRHTRLFVGLAAVVGGVGALTLAEASLRAWEAIRGAPVVPGIVEGHKQVRAKGRIKPDLDVVIRNHPTSGRDVRVRTNNLGLRGPAVDPKLTNEIRVLVLGDSITFGEYLNEEDTYPSALERALAAAAPGQALRVINAGGPNVGTADEAALLERMAHLLEPDLVLVGFYLNDGLRSAPYPDGVALPDWIGWSRLAQRASVVWARAAHRTRHGARLRWVEEFSARRWVNDRAAFDRVIELAESDWGVAWRADSWPIVEQGLERMIRVGRERGFPVLVAAFPVSVQVESRFDDDRPQRRVRGLASRLDLPFLDLLPILRDAVGERLFYDHCHLTPRGNAIVGESLAPFVLEHLKLRRPAPALPTITELFSGRNPRIVASSALGCPMRAQGRRCEAAATPSL